MRGDVARTTPFLPLTMPVSKVTLRMNMTTQPTLRRRLCGGTPGTSIACKNSGDVTSAMSFGVDLIIEFELDKDRVVFCKRFEHVVVNFVNADICRSEYATVSE